MAEATPDTPTGPADDPAVNPPEEVQVDSDTTDGVPGDAAADETPEPVAVEPEPAAATEPTPVAETPVARPPRRPAPVEPDEIDKEFDAVAQAIEEDDILTPGQKAKEKLDLKMRREQRNSTRQREAMDSEEAARNNGAAEHGVSRQVFDAAWEAACAESKRELGYDSPDAARVLMKQKIVAAKAAKPRPTQDPPSKRPVAGQTQANNPPRGQILPRGAQNRVADVPDSRTVMERMQTGDKSLMKEIQEINQGFSSD